MWRVSVPAFSDWIWKDPRSSSNSVCGSSSPSHSLRLDLPLRDDSFEARVKKRGLQFLLSHARLQRDLVRTLCLRSFWAVRWLQHRTPCDNDNLPHLFNTHPVPGRAPLWFSLAQVHVRLLLNPLCSILGPLAPTFPVTDPPSASFSVLRVTFATSETRLFNMTSWRVSV